MFAMQVVTATKQKVQFKVINLLIVYSETVQIKIIISVFFKYIFNQL